VVGIAALDVRRRPDHRSELRSQLLLGEIVRILSISPNRQWWRIENARDRYRGWIRSWGAVPMGKPSAHDWFQRARARVVRSYGEVRAGKGTGPLVSPLFWNSRLIVGRASGRFRSARLPDGRRGWIESSLVATDGRPVSVLQRVRSLLGVPYLWGGRTCLGLDCSAFTQQVLFEQGFSLPRDADQQFRSARTLGSGVNPRLGDLVFFGPRRGPLQHVGLMLGSGHFAHCRGHVHITWLDPHKSLTEQDLIKQIRGFRRPSRGPSGNANCIDWA
jgi:cell wall-associated NlpC family hydrolase